MKRLILVRHGESQWNRENRFTGWVDVPLSEKGINESLQAAQSLMKEKVSFDVAYTSLLKRAIRTLWIILEQTDRMWVPVYRTWRLNERHYGDLQGRNKIETVERYGADQVQLWRRSFDIPPPVSSPENIYQPQNDPRYPPEARAIATECLKDTIARLLPYWHETIANALREGKDVLVVAHGNSLRGLVKYLDGVSEDQIVAMDIPTGIPLVYELNGDLSPIRHYYLGDPEAIQKAIQSVANQTQRK
jgi:2,3-bisphosphoglycerate-dependent phosphoglycerate mutase